MKFRLIPREVRSSLKSISLTFTSFETNILLKSLEGCINLEILNLTSVSWDGEFLRKVYLPKLKSFTFTGFTSLKVTSTSELIKYIFFYQVSNNWEQDTELWANVDIFLRGIYMGDGAVEISGNQLTIRYLGDSTLLNTVLRSRQIKNLTLESTVFSEEELKYLSGVKSVQFDDVSLWKTPLSEVIQHCVNPSNIQIEAHSQPEAVDLALISTTVLKSLRLIGVSLRWSSTGIPLYFPKLEELSLQTCDFNSSLVKFTSSLEILNLQEVNILSGTVNNLFQNLTALKKLDFNVHSETIVQLDISLTPFIQELKLRNCEIFSSQLVQFPNIERLDFNKVKIQYDLMKNVSMYFKNAEYMLFRYEIGPLLLTEILKTKIRTLRFEFNWEARGNESEYYGAAVNYLTSLGVPEGKSGKIYLQAPWNETEMEYFDDGELYDPGTLFTVYKAIFFSVCSIGLIGNAMSALVLSRKEMLKLSSSYILLGLTFWDTLFVTTSLIEFVTALLNVNQQLSDEITKRAFKYLLYPINKSAYTGSVYLTMMITVDRFIAVSMPLRAKSILTSKRTQKFILFLGVFSVLLNFPRWIESIRWEYPYEGRYWNFYRPKCLVMIDEYRIIYQLYGWSFFMYVIPFGLMMALNVKIWWEIRRANEARRGLSGQTSNSTDTSVTKMLMSVVILFLICNTLNALTIWYFLNYSPATRESDPTGLVLVMVELIALQPLLINSSANFIIYCTMGTKFRAECIQLFRRIFKTCGAIQPRTVGNHSSGVLMQNASTTVPTSE